MKKKVPLAKNDNKKMNSGKSLGKRPDKFGDKKQFAGKERKDNLKVNRKDKTWKDKNQQNKKTVQNPERKGPGPRKFNDDRKVSISLCTNTQFSKITKL